MFTGAILSKCVSISSKCCTCHCKGIRVAECFLKTAVVIESNFYSTIIYQQRIEILHSSVHIELKAELIVHISLGLVSYV